MTIDILLATYNGAKYLPIQLQSIEEQEYADWHLWIRDDLSSDSTLALLEEFKNKHPDKVTLIPSDKRLGVIANFEALLKSSTAPYIAFCDQDDRWDSHKLSECMKCMHSLEKQYSQNTPLLVHSNARLVDSSLSPIAPSFWQFARLFPAKTTTLNRLLAQNVVTGCTTLFNRALAKQALPFPSATPMHDWWLALIASAFGKIGVIESPLIDYRQHGNNTLGAVRFGSFEHIKRAWERSKKLSAQKREQAKALLALDGLPNQYTSLLSTYINLHSSSFPVSKWQQFRYGYKKQGFLRQLYTFFFLKQP